MKHLLNVDPVPGTVLNTLSQSSHLILTATLRGSNTNNAIIPLEEEMEAQRA